MAARREWTNGPTDLVRCTEDNSKARGNRPGVLDHLFTLLAAALQTAACCCLSSGSARGACWHGTPGAWPAAGSSLLSARWLHVGSLLAWTISGICWPSPGTLISWRGCSLIPPPSSLLHLRLHPFTHPAAAPPFRFIRASYLLSLLPAGRDSRRPSSNQTHPLRPHTGNQSCTLPSHSTSNIHTPESTLNTLPRYSLLTDSYFLHYSLWETPAWPLLTPAALVKTPPPLGYGGSNALTVWATAGSTSGNLAAWIFVLDRDYKDYRLWSLRIKELGPCIANLQPPIRMTIAGWSEAWRNFAVLVQHTIILCLTCA